MKIQNFNFFQKSKFSNNSNFYKNNKFRYFFFYFLSFLFFNIVNAEEIPMHQESVSMAVDVFQGGDSKTNSFVLSDGNGAFIVNTIPDNNSIDKIADLMKKLGISPQSLLITNNNPDHFSNIKGFLEKFPDLKILVVFDEVKKAILKSMPKPLPENTNTSQKENAAQKANAEQKINKETNKEPEMTVYNKSTFELQGGGKLEIIKSENTSAPQETILFSPDLNALFPSDLAFNKVHPKLEGVSPDNIQSWQQELRHLKSKYGNNTLRVYPGHGNPDLVTLLEVNINYLQAFMDSIQSSFSEAESLSRMQKLYGNYSNPNQTLEKSIKYHIQVAKKTLSQ